LVGELSEDKEISVHSKNNGHWDGKAFARDISRELGCPVFAENDGAAAALGEAYYGTVKTDFAYIIWGTGIGGATVIRDQSGKPNATILDWHQFFGDWEYACGGSELENLYGRRPEELSDTEWQKVLRDFMQYLTL
jgi:predicted NBD/HSP70 family sugar kinase